MNKTTFSLLALLVALALFFSVNLASAALFKSSRFDWTENKLYTLADGTKNILRGMQDPVTLRFYFSKKLASEEGITHITDYAKRIEEMLQEYESWADGKLELYSIDPEPFSEEEDRAVGYGLHGEPANRAGELLYFGIVGTNSVDDEEAIPFFTTARQEFLEYDLTRLIYKLAYSDKTVVGMLTTLPIEGGFNPMNPQHRPEPWYIADQLRELSDLRTISPGDTEIPEEVEVLVAIHPKGLSPELLFAIDQFVLRGGKLIAFLDPHCEADPVPQDPNNPLAGVSADRSSDLGALLAAWGVEMPEDKVVGDRQAALEVGYQNQPVDYVVFLGLDGEAMSSEDPVTGQLELVRMGTAGVLRHLPGATTTFTPLLRTSEDSMEVDRMSVALYPDPTRILGDFHSGGQRLTLAARLSGHVKTAFPEGDPGAKEEPEDELPSNGGDESAEAEEEPNAEEATDSLLEGDINVILVADADMLADQWWVRPINLFGQRFASPTANNADFLVNAIDNMSGSSDLISLRSRPSFGRPFERVVEIRRAADERYRDQERQLEEKLKEIEARINELQAQKGDGVSALILSPEQREQIEAARDEQVKTREKLRDVKHSLQKEIESLGTRLKVLNVLAVPLLVAAFALAVGYARSHRRRD